MTDLIPAFAAIVGEAYVLHHADAIAPFTADYRHLVHSHPIAVLRPANTAQVAAIVKLCAAERIIMVPQGGNTSYTGGAVPAADQTRSVIISLSRLNTIRTIDADNFTVTAEAGCILETIQNAVEAVGRMLPIRIASQGSAQLGGAIATNAGGILTLRYGNMREQVLGIEAVLPNGDIWHGLRSLRKDNTGYDLKQLFIGAEGSLGIVTAAVLRLQPLPVQRETCFVALADLPSALPLYAAARQALGDVLSAFELVPRAGVDMCREYGVDVVDPLPHADAWMILVEVTASQPHDDLRARIENFLATALDQGWITDGTIAANEQQRHDLWRLREAVPEVQRIAGHTLKCDIAVPVAAIPEFIAAGTQLVVDMMPNIRPVAFGHFGDGNIHFNFVQPRDMDGDAFLVRMHDMEQAVHDLLIHHYHGSFAAEHGIGQFKRDELAQRKSPVEMALMRTIKRALDPDNIMNPGSVVAV